MTSVWDRIYAKDELLDRPPHPEIEHVAHCLITAEAKRVLDLGSGGGRHQIYLSEKGFDVYGLDSSPTGLAYTLQTLSEMGLTGHVTLHDMSILPYDNQYFDAVISVQVIHHNKIAGVHRTIEEIARVLRMGGLLWVTMPISKNEPSTHQKEIEPGTFVPLDGREQGLPHHYFREEEIPVLLAGFSVLDLHVDSTNHYSVLARRQKT